MQIESIMQKKNKSHIRTYFIVFICQITISLLCWCAVYLESLAANFSLLQNHLPSFLEYKSVKACAIVFVFASDYSYNI